MAASSSRHTDPLTAFVDDLAYYDDTMTRANEHRGDMLALSNFFWCSANSIGTTVHTPKKHRAALLSMLDEEDAASSSSSPPLIAAMLSFLRVVGLGRKDAVDKPTIALATAALDEVAAQLRALLTERVIVDKYRRTPRDLALAVCNAAYYLSMPDACDKIVVSPGEDFAMNEGTRCKPVDVLPLRVVAVYALMRERDKYARVAKIICELYGAPSMAEVCAAQDSFAWCTLKADETAVRAAIDRALKTLCA